MLVSRIEAEFPDILQQLKAALWFSIGKIVDEEALKLGVNATPQFIGALTEMVWAQIGNTGNHMSSDVFESLKATIRDHKPGSRKLLKVYLFAAS